jgi:ribosomal protein S18 acetylase RimI-like enzyme
MTIVIRQAGAGDEATLAALNRPVQELHVANPGLHFKPHNAEDAAAWFLSRLENPLMRIWIAEESGKAVGYVCVRHSEREENLFQFARRWHEIEEIGVDPGFQRRGIGRQLVQKVFDEARALGISEVELSTWSFNEDAQKAFQRLGFAPKWVRLGVAICGDDARTT